jgi:hypothetical protein
MLTDPGCVHLVRGGSPSHGCPDAQSYQAVLRSPPPASLPQQAPEVSMPLFLALHALAMHTWSRMID